MIQATLLAGTLVLPGTCQEPQRTLLQRLPGGEARTAKTEWTHLPVSVRVNMSRLLQQIIQREGYVLCQPDHAATDGALVAQQRQGRGKARECVHRGVDCGTGPSGSRRTRGQRTVRRNQLQDASVTASLGRWQAAEMSWRRAAEASKKSAEALHHAQRESDEVLDNLLQSIKPFCKQVCSIS